MTLYPVVEFHRSKDVIQVLVNHHMGDFVSRAGINTENNLSKKKKE